VTRINLSKDEDAWSSVGINTRLANQLDGGLELEDEQLFCCRYIHDTLHWRPQTTQSHVTSQLHVEDNSTAGEVCDNNPCPGVCR